MEEVQQPLSQEAAFPPTPTSPPASASQPATGNESLVTSMRIYVRGFRVFVAVAYVLMLASLFFGTLRTRMIRPRSLSTKSTKNLRLCRIFPPLSHLTYRTRMELEPEMVWPICMQRSHKHTDITAFPPFNFDIMQSPSNLILYCILLDDTYSLYSPNWVGTTNVRIVLGQT
jgi:hypothetical protein